MNTKSQKVREEIADDVFHGIPPQKERKNMSAEKLAILLSECEKDTPKYILISHELNLRIVKEQNKPKYYAIMCGFIGIVLGWLLTQWHPLETYDKGLRHVQSRNKEYPIADSNKKVLQPQPEDLYAIPRGVIHPTIPEPTVPKEKDKQDDAGDSPKVQKKVK